MSRPTLISLIAQSVVLVTCLNAEDAWKTKDPAQWTDQDINQILNDSPWVKQVTVSMGLTGGSPGGGRDRAGGGGVGMPGGGIGGYPRGGRYPGGAGSDEYPRGGSRGGGEGAGPSFTATIRWETALPVKQALQRSSQDDQTPKKADGVADQSAKQYVIGLLGMPVTGERLGNRRRNANGGDIDSDGAASGRQPGRDPETIREELMETSQLVRKGRAVLRPTDVKINPPDAPGEIRFVFAGQEPIDLDDKEVSFETQLGRMKIEKKFKLKDMTYKGKLEL